MKKIILLVVISVCTVSVNAQRNWNIGVQTSATANKANFKGGMSEANALFTNNPYGSIQIGVYGRKTINEHFSVQSGIDFSEFGFSYLLAQDYNLMKSKEHYAELRTGTCITRIPVEGIYNSKLNCRNVRFVAGLGLSIEGIDNKWKSETIKSIEGEGLNNTGIATMTEQTHSTQGVNGSFITLIGAEKVFSRGNVLSFTFQGNHGFAPIAESTVTYTVDNKNYNHTFSNNGSYVSMTLGYYFLPIGTKKMNKAVKKPILQN